MKRRIEGIQIIVLFFIVGIIFSYICESYNYLLLNISYLISLLLFLFLSLNKNLIFSRCCKPTICLLFLLCGASNYALFNNKNGDFSLFSSADKLSLKSVINEQVSEKIKILAPNREENSVLLAITLGNKSTLSKEQKAAFSSSGAMHILALSGLHISILFTLFKALLFCLNFSYSSKRVKLFLLFVCIIFYGYITGFNSPVQRATIMIIIYYICVLYGRKYNKTTALCISAFIILCLSPSLLFSVGFQLSFAAIIGIFYIFPTINSSFAPILERHIPIIYRERFSGVLGNSIYCIYNGAHFLFKYFCSTVSLSIACQITTLPLCLYYFGSSSNYFIITNLLAIPVATNILYLFVFSFILHPIPLLGEFLAKILVWNIKLLNIIVGTFA